MPAIESKYSRCTGATLVTTAWFGSAMRASAAISPACDMPISTTARSYSGSDLDRVEVFEMHGGNVGYDGLVWKRDARERGNFSGVRHAHFHYREIVFRFRSR